MRNQKQHLFRSAPPWLGLVPLIFLPLLAISQCSTDADADGWTTTDGDCNDNDATVHPGATELCDAQDNDCNDKIDEVCWDAAVWDSDTWGP